MIKKVIKEIGNGFNFVLAKKETLYAYWSGYNKLFYTKIKDIGYIICTYPIFKGDWTPFKKQELIKFQKGKIIRKEIIRCSEESTEN